MNFRIKLRLAALGLALGLLGALIVGITLSSERHVDEVSTRLGVVDIESMRIADRFKDKLRYATDQMRRYARGHDPAGWEEFLKASQEVKEWMQSQAPNLAPGLELQVLRQMESTYADYMLDAQKLHDQMEANSEASASFAEYDQLTKQARRLHDFSLDLARVHAQLRNQVLDDANRTLTQLRLSVLGLVALLFLSGLALAALVYRDIIAPLRVKLVESQALAERNEKLASLGLLAAGVAHEVRNPLTAIKTALFILQRKFRPNSPERADAEVVEREILRLERIVNEFLRFARPADPALVVVAAEQPLREVQALLAPQLAQRGIQLLREPAAPLQVKVDPSQIQQVLINLVQNAVDSINGAGTITLRARHDRKRLINGETDVVILEVADTGKGIPPEVEARIFDPFFTTKDNGTGLGLSIAARIVQKQGGSLQYKTQINRGSTFGIVLPQAST